MNSKRHFLYNGRLYSESEAVGDQIYGKQVYLAADVEAVEADLVEVVEALRDALNMVSLEDRKLNEGIFQELSNIAWRDKHPVQRLLDALAAKEHEANEREAFYAGLLNDAERERASLRDQLAAKEAEVVRVVNEHEELRRLISEQRRGSFAVMLVLSH